jgi:homoserine kinase type II
LPYHELVNEVPEFTQVLSLWPLGTCLNCRRLTAGRNNESFHLRTEVGEYVLRRSRTNKSFEALAFEHSLIAHLRQKGFPVPKLIPSLAGLSWESCGGRFWTVSQFIVGDQPIRHQRTASLGGEILAHFHVAMDDFQADTPVPPEANRIVEVLSTLAACQDHPALTAEVSTLITRSRKATQKTAELLELSAKGLPRTIIHGSCRLTSLLMQNDKIVALLDMDSARCGSRAEDIAIALGSFAKCRAGSAAVDSIMANCFHKAYTSILDTGPAEAEAIPAHLAQALLFPWVKAMERSLAIIPYDPYHLAKAQWRLAAAEHAISKPQQIVSLMRSN